MSGGGGEKGQEQQEKGAGGAAEAGRAAGGVKSVHRSIPMEKWMRKGGRDSLTPQAKSSLTGARGESQRMPAPAPRARPSEKRASEEALPASKKAASFQREANWKLYSREAASR